MNLRAFHILFVACSSLLAFVVAAWSLGREGGPADAGNLLLAALAGAAGVGLIVYGVWFWRKIQTREQEDARRRKTMRPLAVLAVLWLAGSRAVPACTVCYGAADGPLIDAAGMGVWLLFGLVGMVQLSFATFFIQLWRRARRSGRTLDSRIDDLRRNTRA